MNTQQQVRKLLYWVHKKVDGEQSGIPTIFDNMVIDQANFYLRSTDPDGQLPVVLRRAFDTLQTSSDERFIDVATRIRNLPVSDLDTYGRMYSQGVQHCFHWRGSPLFKSVQDSAIYQMLLWELRPSTIIEVGATAASLCWLNGLTRVFGLQTRVVGVDRVQPQQLDEGILFIQGDVANVKELLPPDILLTFHRPWLVIEDAHVNVFDVIQ